VELKNGFFLPARLGVLLAQGPDFADGLGVEAVALGLLVDGLHVLRQFALFLLQPLNALYDRAELVARNRVMADGSRFTHQSSSFSMWSRDLCAAEMRLVMSSLNSRTAVTRPG